MGIMVYSLLWVMLSINRMSNESVTVDVDAHRRLIFPKREMCLGCVGTCSSQARE